MLKLNFSSVDWLRRRFLYLLVSLAVALGICLGQPIVAQAVPWAEIILRGVQVIQLANLSDKQEIALGGQINNELVRSGQAKISRDRALNAYINQIGQRLAKESTRSQIPYKFQVVQNNQINAFATMGGYVYVNTGLMKAADNEAQLASVIGHEIGHIVGRHSVNQMKSIATAQLGTAAAGLSRSQAVAIGVDLALRRPNSRAAEYEADDLGLKMLGDAGYAQTAMPTFMKKLVGASSTPTFLNTHPATPDRISRMNQKIDRTKGNTGSGLNANEYRNRINSLL